MREIQKGFALVLVLWMLALLTVLAGGYSVSMRLETRLTENYLQSAQAGAVAEAGVWLATQELQKPETERRWRSDNTLYDINIFKYKLSLRIQNESGKIDLNTARPELLQTLLESTNGGQSDRKIDEILQAILDWRDRDDLTRTNGAEDDEYKNAGYDYGAKNGPFNNVEELRLVMGVTDELYRKIAGVLTVYSRQQGINPLYAGRIALLALPDVDEQVVNDYIMSRESNTLTDSVDIASRVDSNLLTKDKNMVFSITSTGIISGSQATIVAVILLTRNTTRPYFILSWKEI